MADTFRVDTLRSLDSEVVNETIKEGEPVVRTAGGGLRLLDPASDEDVKHLVVHQRAGDHNERHQYDYTNYDDLYTYEPAAQDADDEYDDRAPILPLAEHDVVRSYSIEDTTMTEPVFEANTTVGFIAAPNGPRLVEEGYTDDFSGSSTTYNEANGNFVTLGSVDKRPVHRSKDDAYDELVSVRVE